MGWTSDALTLQWDGASVDISLLYRTGTGRPLVCLHGFGSTKEDYADLAWHSDFRDRPIIAFDAPGCGRSTISRPEVLSIPFLMACALEVCDRMELDRFHLLGHSMGGLTALMLAHSHPERVLSFFNIEGNVSAEDCFLSRQIIEHPAETPEMFLDEFCRRVSARPEFSSALYAASLPVKVTPQAVAPIFTSMVHLSDHAPLMDHFTDLNCPRAFVYGTQNQHLSYLTDLPGLGVQLIEISNSAHFPMYSNPTALWGELASFIKEAEATRRQS